MKNLGFGKARELTDIEIDAIRVALPEGHWRLIWDIAVYTGERWGAIMALKVSDCYQDPVRRIPQSEITYQWRTRKQSGGRRADTRQVPIHPKLYKSLARYSPPHYGFMFPSSSPRGHISIKSASQQLAAAVARAGIPPGVSTHSTRRTFITRLARSGVGMDTIQQITGHKSLAVLAGYIQSDPEVVRAAINCL